MIGTETLPAPPPVATVRLMPREHGAYYQFFAPLLAAFMSTRVTLAGVAFAWAAGAAFLAHEPLLAYFGKRGRRAQRTQAAFYRQRLAWLVAQLITAGSGGLYLASAEVRLAAIGVAVIGLIVTGISLRKPRGMAGEIGASVVFAFFGTPVALAGGMDVSTAATVGVAWAIAFAMGVVSVRGILAVHRQGKLHAGWIELGIGLALLSALMMCGKAAIASAVLPLVCANIVFRVWAPSPKHLKFIGYGLVGATVLSAVLLARAVR